MAWYDIFAVSYDLSVESVYRGYRPQIRDALAPEPGQTILDLACGTGPNFAHLVEAVGDTGRVLGVDLSAGMLRRAQTRIDRAGWTNVSVVEKDARALSAEDLGQETVDGVLVTLGLSVIPDWEDVFRATFDRLRPGGRYAIFDVYAEKRVPIQSWMVELMAQADLSRRVWEPLEKVSEAFERKELPGSPLIHGGRPFVATGRKA